MTFPPSLAERDQLASSKRPADIALTVFLLVAQLVLGFAVCFAVQLSLFNFAACQGGCINELGVWAFRGIVGITVISVVAAAVASAARIKQSRRGWWVPVIGMTLIITTFAVALFLVDIGTNPSIL